MIVIIQLRSINQFRILQLQILKRSHAPVPGVASFSVFRGIEGLLYEGRAVGPLKVPRSARTILRDCHTICPQAATLGPDRRYR
jgi:hypothetical protein